MATPMTAGQFLSQLKKYGVQYQEHDGWQTHNRNAHGDWKPNGLVLHHTGDDAPDTLDFKVLWNGRSDLPGPLCQWGMDDNGVVQLVGWGRANHAGQGASNVLKAVVAQNYQAYPPKPGTDDTDGNVHFYGQETMYSGSHAPTNKAYDATVKVFAAVCDFHGWTSKTAIGHKEWTSRKPDPGHLDMALFRADVQKCINEHKNPNPVPPVPPIKPTIVVSTSLLASAAKLDPSRPQGKTTPGAADMVKVVETALVAEGFLSKQYVDGSFGSLSVAAYKKWQEKLGYTGSAADGIPGYTSLSKLGAKYHFTVVR